MRARLGRCLLLILVLLLAGCTAPETPAAQGPGETPAPQVREETPSAPRVAETLTAPTPRSPAPGAVRVDGRGVTLQWDAGVASQGSAVSMRPLVNGQAVQGCAAAVGRTSCTASFTAGVSVTWLVEATTAGGLSARSAPVTFRTNAAPTTPGIDPEDDGLVQVPLSDVVYPWRAATDPDGDRVTYDLVGRTGGAFAFSCVGVAETECAFPRLRAGREYEVTLRAKDALGLESPTATFRFTTALPVVLVHGWNSDGSAWRYGEGVFEAAGYEVLDFSGATGRSLLDYRPGREEETIEEIAATRVGPAIEEALERNGYPRDQRIDVVAHSMGGLVMRTLLEKPGRYPDFTIPSTWAARVRTLTMLGTPNHGSMLSGPTLCHWGDNVNGEDVWYASCRQMEKGSAFLRSLGEGPSSSSVEYYTIAGGDDDVVGPDSPALATAVENLLVRDACHTNRGCDEYSLQQHDEVYEHLFVILGVRAGES